MSPQLPLLARLAHALAQLVGLAGLGCVILPAILAAPGAPALTTALTAAKRVVQRDAENRAVESWIPFTKLLPGEEVTYTVTCTNTGAEPAAEVSVNLPIPAEMILLPTATPPGVELVCSIDGGKTFDRFELLRVVAPDGASRPAQPDDVRFLRWKFTHAVAPGAEAKVDCHARLK